jgi:hypothetical protein
MLILGLRRTHLRWVVHRWVVRLPYIRRSRTKGPLPRGGSKPQGEQVARGPGFHLESQEVEEIGSDRPEKESVVSDDERNGCGSCSFGSDHEENVSETAEIGFVYDQECVSDGRGHPRRRSYGHRLCVLPQNLRLHRRREKELIDSGF